MKELNTALIWFRKCCKPPVRIFCLSHYGCKTKQVHCTGLLPVDCTKKWQSTQKCEPLKVAKAKLCRLGRPYWWIFFCKAIGSSEFLKFLHKTSSKSTSECQLDACTQCFVVSCQILFSHVFFWAQRLYDVVNSFFWTKMNRFSKIFYIFRALKIENNGMTVFKSWA